MPDLIHRGEKEVYRDAAHRSQPDRCSFQSARVRYRVNRRGTRKKPLPERAKRINREYSRLRARVEHSVSRGQRLWGFTKVQYRGLGKNTAPAYAAFALANLYLVRKNE